MPICVTRPQWVNTEPSGVILLIQHLLYSVHCWYVLDINCCWKLKKWNSNFYQFNRKRIWKSWKWLLTIFPWIAKLKVCHGVHIQKYITELHVLFTVCSSKWRLYNTKGYTKYSSWIIDILRTYLFWRGIKLRLYFRRSFDSKMVRCGKLFPAKWIAMLNTYMVKIMPAECKIFCHICSFCIKIWLQCDFGTFIGYHRNIILTKSHACVSATLFQYIYRTSIVCFCIWMMYIFSLLSVL